ncbi:hypothetical protein F4802DRAFT_418017 [Xylaria palmicola]|nr:hypothetical protein F4802DRAFT_418017 [Xylaria palmicola]
MAAPTCKSLQAMDVDVDEGAGASEGQTDLADLHHDSPSPEKPATPFPTGTLLPGPVANVVSLTTRSTSFALRVGTAIGGYGLGVARMTTLSTLELGRHVLDGILNRAGRDVFVGSSSELARADAESILEMSLESMHQTMSQLVFWTAAGFHAAGTTVSTASQISQLFLSVLDQFFGSTDSSRAIASIITLIRREFQNPATGVQGETFGVMDLILGLCGLAYLQNRCRKMMQEESRRLGHEETIWDVVVLNDGERIDTFHDGVRNISRPQSSGSIGGNDAARAAEHHSLRQGSIDDDDDALEAQLRKQMIQLLPGEAKISIFTSTTTTKTITVDITGPPYMAIPSFPHLGLEQSEVSPIPSPRNGQGQTSNYRVVYKASRNTVRNMLDDRHYQDKDGSQVGLASDTDGQPPLPIRPNAQKRPPVPPRTAIAATSSSTKGCRKTSSEDLAHRAGSVSLNTAKSRNGSPKDLTFKSRAANRDECTANQKKTRTPLNDPRKNTKDPITQVPQGRRAPTKSDAIPTKSSEKKTSIRDALRKRSMPAPILTDFPNRESSSESLAGSKSKLSVKTAWASHKPSQRRPSSTLPKTPIPERNSSVVQKREAAEISQQGNLNYFSSRDLGSVENSGQYKGRPWPPARPLNDHRRSSLVSLTDTLSICSYRSRTPSPSRQNEPMFSSSSLKQKTQYNAGLEPPSPRRTHIRTASGAPSTYAPSIYTLHTRDSETSLILSSFYPKSVYDNFAALESLRRTGVVGTIFPNFHLLRNITRYSRYASAVYGSSFLKFMGISKDRPIQNIADEIHYDVRSFAHHANLPSDSILLASFVDPQGGSDSTGSTDTGVPLVHTVALDEESKAVVLTCRGTLGFEDVLADMMCDYDDLTWKGKTYKVHKGIHASARRLLYGGDGRVLFTIKAALEEYPDYGLVLCGHSLGGAVTALLGVMLAEPSASGVGFLTSAADHPKLLSDGGPSGSTTHICLPSGRPIHVYAYGPPATMSPSLQKATRGLITSIVHGNDMVPFLSLGVLHDVQALALAFKTDNNEAKAEVKRRVWEGLCSGLADKWYNSTKRSNEDDEHWAFVALKTLRASMMSPKLLPPGEVFKIDSTPVMRRDAFTQETIEDIGRPASRIVLKYIRDVEAHFREVHFGSSMLTDHSPGNYEDALRRLTCSVVGV